MAKKRRSHCMKCGSLKIATKKGALKCAKCANLWSRKKYATSRSQRLSYVRRYVLARYGASLEQLELLCIKQAGRCAICLRAWQECPAVKLSRFETSFLQRLNVDHDHATGRIRGLLCHGCNAAIGHFNDDSSRIYAARAYILKHKGSLVNVDLP